MTVYLYLTVNCLGFLLHADAVAFLLKTLYFPRNKMNCRDANHVNILNVFLSTHPEWILSAQTSILLSIR